jgi:hypothetical protein
MFSTSDPNPHPTLSFPQFLHLPSEIVPQTHKKPVRPVAATRPAGGREGGAYRPPRTGGDREGYRRRDDADKETGGDFKPVSGWDGSLDLQNWITCF